MREQLQSALHPAYAIERELGGGGMSRVFAATETALGRTVVVKVLPPDLAHAVSAERFRREIQVAARLQHPHVVPVLTAGEAGDLLFYTMPYVQGETLRDRLTREGALPVPEAARLLREIADALAGAHGDGVVHRDLKPENVLLSRGHALVTDFGVAKALSAAVDDDGAASGGLTSGGVALGTPAYMAPEQAAADPHADHRVDLYAVGVVAYEALAGSHPFAGRAGQAMLAAHAIEAPEPVARRRPTVPPALAALVMRLLEKRPADRPQTADEVRQELEAFGSGSAAAVAAAPARFPRRVAIGLGAAGLALALFAGAAYLTRRGHEQAPVAARAAGSAGKSVAVLPFVNVGGRPEEDYFADGMTDELAGALGAVPGLRVASRTSSFAFKGTNADVGEIGRKLHVASVLEGSVRREGRRLRVRTQLTDVSDGLALWSETYEREERDVFQVQEDIARAIVGALRVRLTDTAPLVHAGTSNTQAHDLYLRGRYFALKLTERDLRRALELYGQALSQDSGYAPAWAGIASAWTELADDFVAPREAYPKARAAAKRALAADSALAEAHVAFGTIMLWTWDPEGAERELRRALALNPSLGEAWSNYAEVLGSKGELDSALAAHSHGMTLDPLNPGQYNLWSRALLWAGRPGEAIMAARQALALDPDFSIAYVRLGDAELAAGDPTAALAAFRRPREFSDRARAGVAMALAALGRTGEARDVLATMERESARRYVRGEMIAWGYAALGDRDRAFRWLERAYADRSGGLAYVERAPALAGLRGDPRFVALTRKVRPW